MILSALRQRVDMFAPSVGRLYRRMRDFIVALRDGVIPGGINTRFHETFEVFWKRGYQCRKLDKARGWVQNADVERWVSCGTADCKNFLFSST